MEHPIFKLQQDKAAEIEKVLAKYRGTEAWNIAQNAFQKILRTYIHGGGQHVTDEELNQHFERAITARKIDVQTYLNKSKAVLKTVRDVNSPYYMVSAQHQRQDQFFATNQTCPIMGTGNGSQTLNAKFTAQNLYQRYAINATSAMPPRVATSPFPTWDSIVTAMTDRASFDAAFCMTDAEQGDAVFAVTSALDWTKAEGALFCTPDLFDGAVFTPALYSVYFIGADANAFKNIYFFVSADGFGNPEKPFVGIVQQPITSAQVVYNSINRFAFSYLSDAANPVKYWMEVQNEQMLDYVLNVQSFFPDHTTSPYIEVNASFSAHASIGEVAYFKDIPGLTTIMMIQKGTLMKDLIKAYFPESTEAQLWEDVGVLTGDHAWLNDLLAIGLDAMSDIFAQNVWTEAPVVVPTA
jgi:hypothetical protein